MGVWIETPFAVTFVKILKSHPVWVCGLKLVAHQGIGPRGTSHPVWVCGLKRAKYPSDSWHDQVTPCMGVWIETLYPCVHLHPSYVTPCMGVWIETNNTARQYETSLVTPCMGVWIETCRTAFLPR